MAWLDIAVLAVAAAATAWLIYYVRWYLPERLDERFRESLRAFSTAVELRFPTHAGLSQRVVALSLGAGRHMGLKARQLRDLQMASTLRDIGLCAIPYSLVNDRIDGEWTEAEQMTYDRHPEVSGAMLELVPSLSHLAPVVRWHHANFDGKSPGDPTVPTGRRLPPESRILKVVTQYVWIERTHGDLLARETIREGIGSLYCPDAAEALFAVLTSARVGETQTAASTSRS